MFCICTIKLSPLSSKHTRGKYITLLCTFIHPNKGRMIIPLLLYLPLTFHFKRFSSLFSSHPNVSLRLDYRGWWCRMIWNCRCFFGFSSECAPQLLKWHLPISNRHDSGCICGIYFDSSVITMCCMDVYCIWWLDGYINVICSLGILLCAYDWCTV